MTEGQPATLDPEKIAADLQKLEMQRDMMLGRISDQKAVLRESQETRARLDGAIEYAQALLKALGK